MPGSSMNIVFDEDARRAFLTGFHKRKVARREQAKQKALLREKQERRETRREHRRELAERAARNAAEVEKAYGMATPSSANDERAAGSEAVEDEYEGEEQLATVTVVQDFDLSTPTETSWRTDYKSRMAERRKQRARRSERAELAGRAARKRK